MAQEQFEALKKKLRLEREAREYEKLNKEIKKREANVDRLKRRIVSGGKQVGTAITSKIKTRDSGDKAFKGASKAYRATKKLSNTLLSYGAGFANPQQSGGYRGPGRPAGVMKHRSPFTGKPIPAPQFYKEMRAFRRQQSQQADQVQTQQQVRFARQGVAPNQIQQTVEQRMKQQFMMQQMAQQRPMPQQFQQVPQQFRLQPPQGVPSNAVRPIWRRYNMPRYERDIFGNPKVVQGGNDPRNFWN